VDELNGTGSICSPLGYRKERRECGPCYAPFYFHQATNSRDIGNCVLNMTVVGGCDLRCQVPGSGLSVARCQGPPSAGGH
jgi:hypothetical protein